MHYDTGLVIDGDGDHIAAAAAAAAAVLNVLMMHSAASSPAVLCCMRWVPILAVNPQVEIMITLHHTRTDARPPASDGVGVV